jgi:hypothetical protein
MPATQVFVSLGSQCHTPAMFGACGVRSASLPFDAAIVPAPFLLHILTLLVGPAPMAVQQIVRDHLFAGTDTVRSFREGQYLSMAPAAGSNGSNGIPFVRVHGAIFPHVRRNVQTFRTFDRRLARLRAILLDVTVPVTLVYVGQPGGKNDVTVDGARLFDGAQQQDTLQRIHALVASARGSTAAAPRALRLITFTVDFAGVPPSQPPLIVHVTVPTRPGSGAMAPELQARFRPLVPWPATVNASTRGHEQEVC